MITNTFQIQWHELHYIKLSELCAGLPKALKEISEYVDVSFGDGQHTIVTGDDVLRWIEMARGNTTRARRDCVRLGLQEECDDCDDTTGQLCVFEDRILAHVGADGLISMES